MLAPWFAAFAIPAAATTVFVDVPRPWPLGIVTIGPGAILDVSEVIDGRSEIELTLQPILGVLSACMERDPVEPSADLHVFADDAGFVTKVDREIIPGSRFSENFFAPPDPIRECVEDEFLALQLPVPLRAPAVQLRLRILR